LPGNQRVESREDAGNGQGYGEAEHFTTSEGRHDDRLQQGSISLKLAADPRQNSSELILAPAPAQGGTRLDTTSEDA
jgi:hypothetical protein